MSNNMNDNYNTKAEEQYDYESDSDNESSCSHESEIVSWPTFETNVFSYSKFSIGNKLRLFKLVSQYWVYCNLKDTKTLYKAVGVSNEVIKDILHYILCISSKKWENQFTKRVNFQQFRTEYFQYINDTENVNEDTDNNSVIVRDKFNDVNKYTNLNIIQKQNDIFMNILDSWISLKTNIYSKNEMKNIIIKILTTEFNNNGAKIMDSILLKKVDSLLKKFNTFIASSDFENANLLKNSQGWIYPKMYWVATNTGNDSGEKLEQTSKKRNHVDISYTETDSEIEFIEEKKMKIDKQPEVDMTKLSEFIDNLPSKMFLLLVYKDAINIKGEIKNKVNLSDEEKMSVSSEIIQGLIHFGIINN